MLIEYVKATSMRTKATVVSGRVVGCGLRMMKVKVLIEYVKATGMRTKATVVSGMVVGCGLR